MVFRSNRGFCNQIDQIDHLEPNLLLWHVVQDLHSTDPTQVTHATLRRSCGWYGSHPAAWATTILHTDQESIHPLKHLDNQNWKSTICEIFLDHCKLQPTATVELPDTIRSGERSQTIFSKEGHGSVFRAGLWTESRKWLGRFFGFSPKSRSVSVGFLKETPTEHLSVGFSVGFSAKPAKRSTFRRVRCAFVGIMWRHDRMVWNGLPAVPASAAPDGTGRYTYLQHAANNSYRLHLLKQKMVRGHEGTWLGCHKA